MSVPMKDKLEPIPIKNTDYQSRTNCNESHTFRSNLERYGTKRDLCNKWSHMDKFCQSYPTSKGILMCHNVSVFSGGCPKDNVGALYKHYFFQLISQYF